VRELKEETGYVGTVSESSPVMFNGKPSVPEESSPLLQKIYPSGNAVQVLTLLAPDPGFCNTNLRMVHVNIDMAHPANQPNNLRPELEENEFIEVFTIPLARFWDECKRLEKEGYAIDARVGTLAEGMELARRFAGKL
jgi:hypothetical protein